MALNYLAPAPYASFVTRNGAFQADGNGLISNVQMGLQAIDLIEFRLRAARLQSVRQFPQSHRRRRLFDQPVPAQHSGPRLGRSHRDADRGDPDLFRRPLLRLRRSVVPRS